MGSCCHCNKFVKCKSCACTKVSRCCTNCLPSRLGHRGNVSTAATTTFHATTTSLVTTISPLSIATTTPPALLQTYGSADQPLIQLTIAVLTTVGMCQLPLLLPFKPPKHHRLQPFPPSVSPPPPPVAYPGFSLGGCWSYRTRSVLEIFCCHAHFY